MVAKIVVLGSFNADLVTYVKRLPRPGETLHAERFITGPGGKGSNQAVAAARLGAQTTFVGRVGTDTLADIGLALWQRENIDTRYLSRDSQTATGVASIFVEEAGQNVIVVTLGANNTIGQADVDAAETAIAQADFLMAQFESPLPIVTYAFRVARARGVKTMLNPAPAMPIPPDLLALTDYLTPNEHELALLANERDVRKAALSLLQSDQQTMVVTLGEQGARWLRRDGTGLIPAYRVDVVDTVGAGDAFNGALAVGLAEGRDLPQAIAFANAAAALSVMKPGAAASMPYRDEVDAFLAQQK